MCRIFNHFIKDKKYTPLKSRSGVVETKRNPLIGRKLWMGR